jgi:ADP-ribose pyrophosphatase YjhB (NUDIX family)
MDKTYTAGGVVLNSSNQILVVNQHGNSWSLPKGHIDPGEDAKQAAEREIREESGISQLSFVKELGSYERHRIGVNGQEETNELKHITIFLYRTLQQKLAPEDPDNPEARWVNQAEVSSLLTHPKDKEFFESIRSEL